MEEKSNTVKIELDTAGAEEKLERIKILLSEIKQSAQEVKDLFKHLF